MYLFKYLVSGEIYIIEDLHTSFHKDYNPTNILPTYDLLITLKSGIYDKCMGISEEEFKELVRSIKNIDIVKTIGDEGVNLHTDSITSIIRKK